MEPIDELLAAINSTKQLSSDCPADQRTLVDAQICLASRSAYFDVFTTVTIENNTRIESILALRDAFHLALTMVQTDAYHTAIKNRYEAFREYCYNNLDKISGNVPNEFHQWMRRRSESSSWSGAV